MAGEDRKNLRLVTDAASRPASPPRAMSNGKNGHVWAWSPRSKHAGAMYATMAKVAMHDGMKAHAGGTAYLCIGPGRTGCSSRSSLGWLIMRVGYFDFPVTYRLWRGTFARGTYAYLVAFRR